MFFPESLNRNIPEIKKAPLLCWDLYVPYIHQLFDRGEDRAYISEILKDTKCNLPNDIETCLAIYDAVVVTNPNQVIEWVSSGFTNMTGYRRDEVLDRRPDFLQGPATSSRVKSNIRKELIRFGQSDARLINYTKSGEAYICDIAIRTITNRKRDILHFIAFEKEIKAQTI